ncbi:MAG: phage holin family protein [Verrucomicrobiae bacterium]|nr:phage holin family protein [Verrucomicrobiae bacterium]
MSDPQSSSIPAEKGVFHRGITTLLEILLAKVELIQLEIEEEKRRLVMIIFLTVLVSAIAFLGLTLVTISLAFLLFEQYKYWALLGLGVFNFILAGGIYFCLSRQVTAQGQVFSETISQLRKDINWLKDQM